MKPEPGVIRLCTLAAGIILLAGCSPMRQNTPSPVVPSASNTPFSADAFLHDKGPDAMLYPFRYFSPRGDLSMEVPVEWEFNQKADTGYEADSFSETRSGAPVAALYALGDIGEAKTPRQAMETFLHLEWVAMLRIEIIEQTEFSPESGLTGWRVAGTAMTDPAQDIREDCILLVFPAKNAAYVLAAYPQRSASPASFVMRFVGMAGSIRFEETRLREVDKSNTLQLAEKEIRNLDPAVSLEGADGPVGDIFSGLAALDTSLTVQPGLAEHWDVSPDGKTYTFHLRPGVQFHNGRPVTAEDVLFSWLRAAGPDSASDSALRYLGDIAGLREYHEAKADDVSGLRIVDARTIQVTLDSPKPFFPAKLTTPVTWIVDRYNVRLPNWQWQPNGTGPFRVAQYVPEKGLLLEADPMYYGTPLRIKNLVYWLTTSQEDALFRSNKVDRMTATADLLPRVNDPHDTLFGSVSAERLLCTRYIQFNAAMPPFDDPLVRKAFALAINRDLYIEVTPEEGDLPGGDILPPGMTGFSEGSSRIPYDPQTARDLLSRSSYYRNESIAPEIRITLPSEAGEFDPTMEFLVRSWENTLDVEVFVEGLPPEEYLERMQGDPPGQFLFGVHCAEFPDPENFYSSLFYSRNTTSNSMYRSETLDALLESAAVEADWGKRMGLYRQADQIIYDDAPLIILAYNGPTYIVWKTRVRGYVPTKIRIPQHHLLWFASE